ncbi:MAG TPA: hypothetical protein VFL57_17070 [Bryobacteraceae bacterium]|nr:hypothetical protein [Bryobacteraceae bacterium]
MALGIEALFALAGILTFHVEHDHLRKTGAGTLSVHDVGIAFEERGEPSHNRSWTWEDIQQLTVEPDRVHILSYRDRKWQAGRDEAYVLTGKIPAESLATFRQRLGAKFVSAVPEKVTAAVWRIPVKLHERFGGPQGELALTRDHLLFTSAARAASRSWPIELIDSVSSANPYELTVYTLERAGWTRSPREFRFQLKVPISEQQYQELWRAVNAARMTIYSSKKDSPQ